MAHPKDQPRRPTRLARDEGIRVIRDALAVGRDLIFFDDADTTLPPERRADARVLDPRPPTAVMRLDPLAPQGADNPSEIPDLYDGAVFENGSPSFGPASDGAAPTP